jgi:GAF domain-containing protein/HAMP domain-containing protein
VTPDDAPASIVEARAAEGASANAPVAGVRAAYRGKLLRKYLILILSLVGGVLLVSGAISVYFAYHEYKSAIAELQHEKALAAAARIEQYIRTIEQQLKYASLPQLDSGDVELRRIEFLKLLRQAPEVTDIAQLDAAGHEQIAVSRLGMDVAASGKDRSQEPAFGEAKRGQTWFGPVYFRKETEPYMTMAIRAGGERGPVTVADVNLKFIWDVVSRIKIGEKGKAYVVDRNGFLVADPDIGLVLRKTSLSSLDHVKAQADPQRAPDLAMVSTDLAGTPVLTSVAAIDPLGWNVFVEQPIAEVYEKLNASIVRTGLLLVAGLVISALGALALARGMVRPIRTLEEGAQRIGAGDLDRKIDVRTGDELEALADRFNHMTGQLKESYAGLERKVEDRTRALQNSLEQQTAISEILRVISSSPTDVQPVLRAVAERAAHLCTAPYARVLLVDGEVLVSAADYSVEPGGLPQLPAPLPLRRGSMTGRAALERETVHHADVLPLIDAEYPDSREALLGLGVRAALAVPLMREGGAYGAIFLFRREPGLFAPDQVALVQTFARQAAIAIDNVRLFNETREALDQQTAISEILRVISSSPGDVRPMLNAVAERALKLCDAAESTIVLVDGDALRCAAVFGSTSTLAEGELMPLSRGSVTGRAVIDRTLIHMEDLAAAPEEEFPIGHELQRRIGHHAILSVPLMREDRAIGAIALWRMETRAFTEKQIALVKTFADQAAIAIENVRLFNETKEALEQQTAISEILRVISSSPGDVRPMLNAVAERALHLCEAAESAIFLVEGNVLRFATGVGNMSIPEENDCFPLNRRLVVGRAAIDRATIHHSDIVPLLDTEYPDARVPQQKFGFRALLAIPLMREERAIGVIALWRREPRAFTEKQIALVKTFADQAAIAIENVRLFNETKEALNQQRASADVLAAISSSIADTAPVFDTILESCERLFAGKVAGINLVGEDGLIRLRAYHGPGREDLEQVFPLPVGPESGSGEAILTRSIVHYPDVENGEGVPAQTRRGCKAVGYKAVIFAPMVWEGKGIGVIFVGRDYVGAFSDKDIALLKTFADQAVIAIQNARLFNETKEALEQQTAISEILRVLSSSPTDVQPVLEAIAERAARICDAASASMYLTEGNMLRHLASKGPGAEPVMHVETFPVNRDSISGRAILDQKTMRIRDMLAEAHEYPLSAEIAHDLGHRSVVVTPLFREGKPFGTIVLRRHDVRPFTDREVDLLRTFGDQAAIALENVRLFNETKEALDQQRASGEVLAAISSSIADTKPVFEVILQSCQRLFAGETVGVTLVRDDGMLDIVGRGPGFDELKKMFPQPLTHDTASGTAILERKVMVYPDIDTADMPAKSRDGCRVIGTQSIVFAPMLFEGRGIGTLWVGRSFKGPFSDKHLALLKTFAEQAVIAIQNARLFNETKEALDQQRASGEVLAAISSSIADTAPVFDRILASCERLFAGKVGQINIVDEHGMVHLAAYHGPGQKAMSGIFPFRLDTSSATGLSIERRAVLHYPDIDRDDSVPPIARAGWVAQGLRALIVAPMMWEGKGVGAVFVGRENPGPYTEKDIALLKTFADQAVIAIQNARLFNETKEALDQQRASGEVLAAISSSIADTAPVFDEILASCQRLFTGKTVAITLVGKDGLIRLGAFHGRGRDEMEKIFPAAIDGETGSGVAILRGSIFPVPDVEHGDDVPPKVRRGCRAVGVKGAIFAPMMWEGKGIGAIYIGRDYAGPFSEKEIALLKTFADQAVIAIQNVRLFREIQDKSRELEIANKHKSEFLANMSHELRTPLNAIIGFSEVLIERMFGELNEKQDDYLKDIHSSGRHLLSLINDILDLSKVEAGRMELEPSSFDLPLAISNAMTLLRERAQRHGIALGLNADPSLGEIVADERKFKQILVNLLSNAVKFTPDGGRIDVSTHRDADNVVISVRDTGIGIAPEDQDAVFEEFRQVGRNYTNKQEGTGLGLALTQKFVELHGGRIWLESEPGKGSTFSFTIPIKP